MSKNQTFQEVTYIGTYTKGKNGKDLRILVESNGKKELIFLRNDPDDFVKALGYIINHIDYIEKTPGNHMKLIGEDRRYKYYYLRNNPQDLLDLFDKWKNSNPLIPVGNFLNKRMKSIPGYAGMYLIDKKYIY